MFALSKKDPYERTVEIMMIKKNANLQLILGSPRRCVGKKEEKDSTLLGVVHNAQISFQISNENKKG